MTYHCDYENEPIGGGNPYYRCVHCQISDPQINGRIEGHCPTCFYRQCKEKGLDYQREYYKLKTGYYPEEDDPEYHDGPY